jgi:hypothetical protein
MRTYFVVASGMSAVAVLVALGSARGADSLGVSNEQLLVTKGKVVDLACELTHECPPDCGAGKRPLGLKTDGGKLYVAAKSNTIFAGLSHDLVAYCGMEIIADGLTTSNYGTTLLMIQRFKPNGAADWVLTDKFATDWAKQQNAAPDGKETEEWYRHDADVLRAVDRHGKTGLEK